MLLWIANIFLPCINYNKIYNKYITIIIFPLVHAGWASMLFQLSNARTTKKMLKVKKKKNNTKYSISDLKHTSVLSFNFWQAIESVLQKIDVNARSALALILVTNNGIYITII